MKRFLSRVLMIVVIIVAFPIAIARWIWYSSTILMQVIDEAVSAEL